MQTVKFKYSLSIYLVLTLIAYAFFNISSMILSLMIGLIITISCYKEGVFVRLGEKSDGKVLVSAVTLILVLSPIALYKSIESIYFIISSIVAINLSFAASKKIDDAYYALRFTAIFTSSALLIYAAMSYPKNQYPLEDLLMGGGSSNVVTSFLIVVQIAYSGVAYFSKREITWVSLILTFVICIIGYGRGSIIASFALLMLFVIIAVSSSSKEHRTFIQLVSFLTALIIIEILYLFGGFNYIINNTKLGSGLVDNARLDMLKEYLENLDWLTILIGGSYINTVINDLYGGNPHNSFIRAHYMLGSIYIFFLLAICIMVLIFQNSILKLFAASGLIVIILFRAFSEPILFPTQLDFYFFILIFYFINSKQIQIKK